MKKFFTYERFGPPQVIALLLLAVFVGQCAYFISHVPLSQVETDYVLRGVDVLQRMPVAVDAVRSPMTGLTSVLGVSGAVLTHGKVLDPFYLDQHRWFIRTPFLIAGFLLGISLWYVARHLYGNHGGYIALGLYAFSPGMIARSSMAGPEILGAWGAFGIVFTAIATAHTLYAPREVVLWNWKRILLLGIAITVAVGAQWSLALLLIPAVLFMWWIVPRRRIAAAVIFLSACAIALLLLNVSYAASFRAMFWAMRHASWFGVSMEMFHTRTLPSLLGDFFFTAAPAAVITFVVALGTYIGWRRTRFFGNTAPLIIALLALIFGMTLTHAGGELYFFYAVPFLIIFSAGVFTDLVQSKSPAIPAGVVYGAMLAQAVYSIAGLMRIFSRGM